jgi:hypothetical protein
VKRAVLVVVLVCSEGSRLLVCGPRTLLVMCDWFSQHTGIAHAVALTSVKADLQGGKLRKPLRRQLPFSCLPRVWTPSSCSPLPLLPVLHAQALGGLPHHASLSPRLRDEVWQSHARSSHEHKGPHKPTNCCAQPSSVAVLRSIYTWAVRVTKKAGSLTVNQAKIAGGRGGTRRAVQQQSVPFLERLERQV